MKKTARSIAILLICGIFLAIPVAAERLLVPGGQVVGMELLDGSVHIAALDEKLGENARRAGLTVGDRIITIDGKKITTAEDVRRTLERAGGAVEICLEREGKRRCVWVTPQITQEGPRLGLCLRQGVTGIGTLSWYDPATGAFGALGHGVNTQKGELVQMGQGNVYRAKVEDVQKGLSGNPGLLMGAVEEKIPVGSIEKNTRQGVFGKMQSDARQTALPVAQTEEIQTGEAVILATVTDQMQEYSVEILQIYPNGGGAERNMLLKVTDPRLLEITGGIVQGMSGSPIIQDGKLVGAVTHVLVNDPTRGYGIFIENMLDAAA